MINNNATQPRRRGRVLATFFAIALIAGMYGFFFGGSERENPPAESPSAEISPSERLREINDTRRDASKLCGEDVGCRREVLGDAASALSVLCVQLQRQLTARKDEPCDLARETWLEKMRTRP